MQPRQPPNVRNDPGATLSSVEAVRAKVRFRIMVPTVIERSSRLSTLEPVRVFKPAPHTHELALTYVTGAGNVYWNVIETNWKDAPILLTRRQTRRIAGRKYHLFTTGGNIHMVVLYKGGSTLLGREHAARRALERDDARDSEGPSAARQVT